MTIQCSHGTNSFMYITQCKYKDKILMIKEIKTSDL